MRWLSRDPIGYKGETNLYEYVGGMPVRYSDPLGLDPSATPTPGGTCRGLPIWICQRPIDDWRGPYLPNHKYVCCDGANQNCYGHEDNNIKKGDDIPKEKNPTGSCQEKKVCEEEKKKKCSVPKSPRDGNTFFWNCRDWAEWDGQ